jgi:acyl phosphate:glycerol-3-phosphate acyltransferase
MQTSLPILALCAVLAYLLGSIPFGLILTRVFGAGDLRKIGSGNIGATNVLRTGRRGLAVATLILDGGKGAVAVLIAYYIAPETALAAAFFSVLGHVFPVWLRFKGGKGVATTIGVLLAAEPLTGVIACLVWLLVAALFRYSSLAALVAIGTSPVSAWLLYDYGHPAYGAGPVLAWSPYAFDHAALAFALAVLVFSRHHENIARLRAGTEGTIKLSRTT